MQNTVDGFFYLVWQLTAFHFGKQRAGSETENGSVGFASPALTPATAPRKLLRRGRLAPSRGALTAGYSLLGKGEEAPKTTGHTKKRRNSTGKGTRKKRKQSWVQMEGRLKLLGSGFPFAHLSAWGTIPKALGREELSRLVHLAQHPPWESSRCSQILQKKTSEQSNLPFPPYSQPAPVKVTANTHFGGCTLHWHTTHRRMHEQQL